MRNRINGTLAILLLVTAGCSSKSAVKPAESTPSTLAPQATEAPAAPAAPSVSAQQAAPTGYGFDKWQTGPLGDVFFDYDSSSLSSDAQGQLKQNAAWLGSNAAKKSTIEGHCDSRGTSEYNLALGERRASSAKDYLVKLGVAASRIESVSFGEEKPFAEGQNEEAWAKNRRAHFIVK
ncbi:MAG: peptidoglycan-associated lipoprotein Pal [Chlorobiaceae bacterium]